MLAGRAAVFLGSFAACAASPAFADGLVVVAAGGTFGTTGALPLSGRSECPDSAASGAGGGSGGLTTLDIAAAATRPSALARCGTFWT